MRSLLKVGAVALVMALLYWFCVPYARVRVIAGADDADLIGAVWAAQPSSALVFLNSWYVEEKLKDLPIAHIRISRERPWNATIEVEIGKPDLVVVEGDRRAAVFADLAKVYVVTVVPDTWRVVEVHGFPSQPSAFAAASAEYAPLLLALELNGEQLKVSNRSLSSKGLLVYLKDGKRLVFGDASSANSKVERAIAVVNMPEFKTSKVTVDLRFDGQAVIPEKP